MHAYDMRLVLNTITYNKKRHAKKYNIYFVIIYERKPRIFAIIYVYNNIFASS
jgi:hypothetical protein